MKTINEVLELAEKLNELLPKETYSSIKIEGLEANEIKELSDQENGNYFKGDSIILPSDWASITLGRVDFILSSKPIVKVKSIF